jgi:hypothetical protein
MIGHSGPVLQRLWDVGDRRCGKLLAPVLPLLLAALERHNALRVPPAWREQLLRLSPATIDRLLQPVRRTRGRQPRRPSPSNGPPAQKIDERRARARSAAGGERRSGLASAPRRDGASAYRSRLRSQS